MKRAGFVLTILGSGAVGIVASGIARAQTGPASQLSSASGLQEGSRGGSEAGDIQSGDILVTARRRSEGLSKVPLSITALSSESLQQGGVRTENDLQIAVPGLQTVNGGNGYLLNFSIRGQTIDGYSGSASAVLTYVNEFQFTSPGPSSFFDIENIQVLKGPQGTLFGRNTTGGAVLYKTVMPGNQIEGFISGRLASFGQVQVQGAVTLPLSEKASLRVAGNFSNGGAFLRNRGYYTLNPTFSSATFTPKNEELGNQRNRSARATLLLRPTETIRNTLVAQYGRDDGTFAPGLAYAASGSPSAQTLFDNIPLIGGPFAGASGGLSRYIAFQRSTNRNTYNNVSSRFRARSWFATNSTDIDLTDSLVLKNIIGWSQAERWAAVDYDGSPFPLYENLPFFQGTPAGRNGQHNFDKTFSEELQLQGEALDGRIKFTVGGFYTNLRHLEDDHFQFYGTVVPAYRAVLRTKSTAGFAQLGYKIADALTLTAGGRYTRDEISITQLPFGAFTGLPGFESRQERSFKKPSWTIGLDYQVTPDLLFYIAQRGSYRAGGFNYSAVPRNFNGQGIVTAANPGGLTGNMFDPELARDVEAGAKYNGQIGGTRVTAAASVYNQWVKGVQRVFFAIVPGIGPGVLTTNVPEAQITGQEFNISVRPSSWFEAGGQIAHTNARFTKDRVPAAGTIVRFGPYAFAPDWAGSVYVQFDHKLGNAGALSWRSEVYAQSASFFGNYTQSGCAVAGSGCVDTGDIRIPGYALVNTRLAWNDVMGSSISIAGYAKNIFDKKWYQGGVATSHSYGVDVASPGRPREIGVEARMEL